MADITIDTSSPQYVQLLDGIGTLRTVLAPRIKLLRQLPREKRLQWLQRDPLMRRMIIMAQSIANLIDEELSE